MKTEAEKQSFDVMKWLRETRHRIYEETKDMSPEEKRRWSEERIRRDPFLAELYDRRRAPDSERSTVRAAGSSSAAIGDEARG